MKRTKLIQRIGDIEMPAAGKWPVAHGQEISVARRGRLRVRRSIHRTTGGELTIGRQLIGSTLVLALSDADASDPVAYRFEGHIAGAAPWGAWHLEGSFTVGDSVAKGTLLVVCNGVYAHGAAPVAWLTIDARCRVPGTVRSSRRHRISLAGEINVVAPTRSTPHAESLSPPSTVTTPLPGSARRRPTATSRERHHETSGSTASPECWDGPW